MQLVEELVVLQDGEGGWASNLHRGEFGTVGRTDSSGEPCCFARSDLGQDSGGFNQSAKDYYSVGLAQIHGLIATLIPQELTFVRHRKYIDRRCIQVASTLLRDLVR